jgi:hypothetical protein
VEFLPDEATPFMMSAVRVFGREVLAAGRESVTEPTQEAVGRQLLDRGLR